MDEHPLRVLLVDDNPDDLILMARELRRAFPGLRISQARDARGFVEAMGAGAFDAVITEYKLPWTDGLEVLGAVKASFPRRPVVMCTATGSEEAAVAAMKAGVDDYLVKSPKGLGRLPAGVFSALQKAGSGRESRQAGQRYQALFESVPVGLYRIAPDGELLEANHAMVEMLGFTDRASLLGRSLASFYAQRADWLDWRERMEREGLVRGFEAEWKNRDGHPIWVRDTSRAVRGEEGQPPLRGQAGGRRQAVCYEGAAEDVSERKRAQAALDGSEQRYRSLFESSRDAILITTAEGQYLDFNQAALRLLGCAAEELRASNARDWYADPTERDRHVREMKAQGFVKDFRVRLRRGNGEVVECLITSTSRARPDGVLLYQGIIREATERKRSGEPHRTEASEVPGASLRTGRAPVATAELVSRALEARRPPEGVEVLLDVAPGLPPALVDPRQVGRALERLVANAYRAMPEGGRLTLSAWREGEAVRLSVADTGAGIPPERLEGAFDGQEGAGLSLCKRLIEANGGSIQVERGAGMGSAFTITLPAAAGRARP